MVRRAPRSSFMPSLFVFPGGRVEEHDHFIKSTAESRRHREMVLRGELLCDNVQQECWGERMAAIREVFEETGLLLAHPCSDTNSDVGIRHSPLQHLDLDSTSSSSVSARLRFHEAQRRRIHLDDVPLQDMLLEAGAHAHVEGLLPLSRWVTPTFEKKRFDTYFYLAPLAMDSDQLLQVVQQTSRDSTVLAPEPDARAAASAAKADGRLLSDEIDHVVLLPPHEVLAASRGDPEALARLHLPGATLALAPPTAYVLQQLAGRSLDDVIASARAAQTGARASDSDSASASQQKTCFFTSHYATAPALPTLHHRLDGRSCESVASRSARQPLAPWLAQRVLRPSDDKHSRAVRREAEAEAAVAKARTSSEPVKPASTVSSDAAAVEAEPPRPKYLVNLDSFISLPGDVDNDITRAVLNRLLRLQPSPEQLEAARGCTGTEDDYSAVFAASACGADAPEGGLPVDMTTWECSARHEAINDDMEAYGAPAAAASIAHMPLEAVLAVWARLWPCTPPRATLSDRPRVCLRDTPASEGEPSEPLFRVLGPEEAAGPGETVMGPEHPLWGFFRYHRVAARGQLKGWNVVVSGESGDERAKL